MMVRVILIFQEKKTFSDDYARNKKLFWKWIFIYPKHSFNKLFIIPNDINGYKVRRVLIDLIFFFYFHYFESIFCFWYFFLERGGGAERGVWTFKNFQYFRLNLIMSIYDVCSSQVFSCHWIEINPKLLRIWNLFTQETRLFVCHLTV